MECQGSSQEVETLRYHGAAVELAAVDVIETSAKLVYKEMFGSVCTVCYAGRMIIVSMHAQEGTMQMEIMVETTV